MILSLWLWQQDLYNFGIQLMQVRNFLKTVRLVQNSHKLNSIAQLLMKMVSVTPVEQMVVFTFGIKNKT